VTDLLTKMKEKIVASQEENVDRVKIQTDIDALRDQIGNCRRGGPVQRAEPAGRTPRRTIGSGTVERPCLARPFADQRREIGQHHASSKDRILAPGKATLDRHCADRRYSVDPERNADAEALRSPCLPPVLPTGTAFSIGIAGTDADASKFTPADYTTGTTTADQAKILYITREGDTLADVQNGLIAAYNGYASKQGSGP
jgi:flagellin